MIRFRRIYSWYSDELASKDELARSVLICSECIRGESPRYATIYPYFDAGEPRLSIQTSFDSCDLGGKQ